MKTIDKLRAFRLSCLIQSLGADGASEYLATLTPKEREYYVAPRLRDGVAIIIRRET